MLDWFVTTLDAAWRIMTLAGPSPRQLDIPGLGLAASIALVAGVSVLLGHGAVMFINRVRWHRALITLLIGGLFTIVLYVLQGVIVGVIAPLITGTQIPLREAAAVVLASSAPLVLGFLSFIAVLGYAIARALEIWSLACLLALVASAYETSWWRAIAVGGIAWVVMQVASRLLGPLTSRITSRILSLASGRPVLVTGVDVLSGAPLLPHADLGDPGRAGTRRGDSRG